MRIKVISSIEMSIEMHLPFCISYFPRSTNAPLRLAEGSVSTHIEHRMKTILGALHSIAASRQSLLVDRVVTLPDLLRSLLLYSPLQYKETKKNLRGNCARVWRFFRTNLEVTWGIINIVNVNISETFESARWVLR